MNQEKSGTSCDPRLVGVGIANNGNVGNANNVNGVAAPTISPLRPDFFAPTGRKNQSALPPYMEGSDIQRTLWQQICHPDNIRQAVNCVMGYKEPELHTERLKAAHRAWLTDREEKEKNLSEALRSGSYTFSPYSEMKVHEPKERIIHYHSLWTDNVWEESVRRVLFALYMKEYSPHAFGSIKGRGTIRMVKHLEKAIRNHPNGYFLQVDVRKFYEHIDKDILLTELHRLFPEEEIREFFSRLIRSYPLPGIPIGIPLSQLNANLYLTPVDRFLEADARVIDLARNMDDMGIVCRTKEDAQAVRLALEGQLALRHLEIKPNWRIAPLTYGMDICGYVIRPTHTALRKSIKMRMKKRMRQLVKGHVPDKVIKQQMASYYGWCQHGDCRHLLQSVLNDKLKFYNKNMKLNKLSDLRPTKFFGMDKSRFVSIKSLDGVEVLFIEWKKVTIKGEEKVAIHLCLTSDLTSDPTEEELAAHSRYTITRSNVVMDRLERDKELLPFVAKVTVGKWIGYE